MSTIQSGPPSPEELHPHLLYRTAGGQAEFATWRLEGGQEALALFTTAETAGKYAGIVRRRRSFSLSASPSKARRNLSGLPGRQHSHRRLDPQVGGARTLFDLAQIVAAAAEAAH